MATTDYRARLAELTSASSTASHVRRARELLVRYGAWLRLYHGGLPVGILALVMHMESDGVPTAVGDQSLGEYGLFQITKYFPPEVGLPADARYDTQSNIMLGCLEYQIHAAKMAKLYGLRKGSQDSWRLSRLDFSIGEHGTTDLANRALARYGKPGLFTSVFDLIRRYVDDAGAPSYGSQSAEKIWYRVHYVDWVFSTGMKVAPGSFGPPQIVPGSPKYPSYSFPKSLLPFTGKPGLLSAGSTWVLAAAIAAGVYFANSSSR